MIFSKKTALVVNSEPNYSLVMEWNKRKAFFFSHRDPLKNGRALNHDSLGFFEKSSSFFFALSDGMGGQEKPALSSQIAVEESLRLVAEGKEAPVAIDIASKKIRAEIGDGGATLSFLRWQPKSMDLYYVGDSQVAFYNKELERQFITTPQNSFGLRRKASIQIDETIDESQFPKNVLINFLGSGELYVTSHCNIDHSQFSYVVLGSDGFWENVDQNTVQNVLTMGISKMPDFFKGYLEEAELPHPDDFSVIVISLQENAED